MEGGGKGTGELTDLNCELESAFFRVGEFKVEKFELDLRSMTLLAEIAANSTFALESVSSTENPRIRLPFSEKK